MYLMLRNTEVLYFDLEDFVVEVIRNDLLPYCLWSNIRLSTKMKDMLHYIQEVKAYLSSRVLSLSRDNAKQIYAAFQIPQVDSTDNRVNICIKCKGVSIVDRGKSGLAEDQYSSEQAQRYSGFVFERIFTNDYDKRDLSGADDKGIVSERLGISGRKSVLIKIR